MQLLVVITSINHIAVELKGFVLHIPTVGQINPDNAVNDATVSHRSFPLITLWLISLNDT